MASWVKGIKDDPKPNWANKKKGIMNNKFFIWDRHAYKVKLGLIDNIIDRNVANYRRHKREARLTSFNNGVLSFYQSIPAFKALGLMLFLLAVVSMFSVFFTPDSNKTPFDTILDLGKAFSNYGLLMRQTVVDSFTSLRSIALNSVDRMQSNEFTFGLNVSNIFRVFQSFNGAWAFIYFISKVLIFFVVGLIVLAFNVFGILIGV